MKDCRISEVEAGRVLMKNVNDRPNALAAYGIAKQTGNDMKDMFDRQFRLLQEKHNMLCDTIEEINSLLAEAMKAADDAAEAALIAGRKADAFALKVEEALALSKVDAEGSEET